MLQTVNQVKRQINRKLKVEGILLTMVDSRTNSTKEVANAIRETYEAKIPVFQTSTPRSVRAVETSSVGVSIFRHDPRGKVAEAYQKLTKEVLDNAEKKRWHKIDQLKKLPRVKDLSDEYGQVLAKEKAAYSKHKEVRRDMKDLLIAKKNVDILLSDDTARRLHLEQARGYFLSQKGDFSVPKECVAGAACNDLEAWGLSRSKRKSRLY